MKNENLKWYVIGISIGLCIGFGMAYSYSVPKKKYNNLVDEFNDLNDGYERLSHLMIQATTKVEQHNKKSLVQRIINNKIK